MIKRYERPLSIVLGTGLSVMVAVFASILFARFPWRGVLPLAFVAVLLLLSKRFGVTVSLTGSLAAAAVFALMLFSPVGSPRVDSDSARMSLGWMILGAVALSYLLYPSRGVGRRPRH